MLGTDVKRNYPRWQALKGKNVYYVCSKSALESRRVQLSFQAPSLLAKPLYLRTFKVLFRTRHDAMMELVPRLGSDFIRVNQGVYVNIQLVTEVDFEGKQKRLGFLVESHQGGQNCIEWVVVSRESFRQLKGIID